MQAGNQGTPWQASGCGRLACLAVCRSCALPVGGELSPRRQGMRWASPPGGVRDTGAPEGPKVTSRETPVTFPRGRAGPGVSSAAARRASAVRTGSPCCGKRVAEARDVGHGGELAGPDDQDVEIGQCRHRGVPRAGSMAASSPKKSPRPSVFTRRPCWVTATEPVRIRKNSRPIRAFAGQHLAFAHLDLLGQVGHVLQLGMGAVPQQVNGFQPLDGRLGPHGGYHDLASCSGSALPWRLRRP